MEKTIKITLAIMLLGCLLDLPYGYYQLVRFVSMAGFAYLAFMANERNNKNEVFIAVTLALLFQPFIKIPLGRTIWNIVDVVVGVGLILSVIMKPKEVTK